MPRRRRRTGEIISAGIVAGALLSGATAPGAHADTVAYLVNVTMRPGYDFATADVALSYGHALCDKVAQGRGYAPILSNIESDFATADEYQASYLLSQAVNELCPALIWQLRKSAAAR